MSKQLSERVADIEDLVVEGSRNRCVMHKQNSIMMYMNVMFWHCVSRACFTTLWSSFPCVL